MMLNTDYGIHDPLVIDNTGVWRDEDGLSKHINFRSLKRQFLQLQVRAILKILFME